MIEVVSKDDIESAQSLLENNLRRLPSQGERHLRFRPSGKNLEMHSNGRGSLFFASHFVRKKTTPRYWNAFGFFNGKDHGQQKITVEINIPKPASRSIAAFFARDKSGRTFLMHDCKMGGGKPGVCREGFLDHSGLRVVEVRSPGGKRRAVIIGALDDKALTSRIELFVRAVEAYKDSVQ